jgi:phospholipid/cholesterol/gamma-HCH transport system substrate-binding protein
MISKVNYTAVGLFVVVLSMVLFTAVVWLTGAGEEEEYETYVAYFRESVSGLNPRSPVKYRGVGIGQVRSISLDKENPERVKLLMDIEVGTPVKEDTVAVITSQGITGLAYVELKGGSKNSPPLIVKPDHRYPEIKTKPSLISQLDMALPNLLTQVSQLTEHLSSVADRLNHLLDDEKQASLAKTLKNVEEITSALQANATSVTEILKNAAAASSELPDLAAQTNQSLVNVGKIAESIQRTTGHLDQLIVETQKGVSQLPQVNPLLTDLRELTENLRGLAQELDRHPNSLVFGRPARAPGPGE